MRCSITLLAVTVAALTSCARADERQHRFALPSPASPRLADPAVSPAHLFSMQFKELASGKIVREFSHAMLPDHTLEVAEPKLCDASVKQYSGYLTVKSGKGVKGSKHFFFWFFESRNDPVKDPLLLWLNGGPGCSSLTGLLMELGPCQVAPKGNGTIHNPHSWNNKANLVFLDQPANVGFSYGEGVQTTVDAANDVYAFLQLFLHAFPKYNTEFHAFGESYGGHYIPAIGGVIHRQRGTKGMIDIQLESLGIGNGLVDSYTQYAWYEKMACDSSYGSVLPPAECKAIRDSVKTCQQLIQGCYAYPSRFTCLPAATYCNARIIGPFQKTGRNPYDVRKKCDPNNSLCYDILNDIETYLNRPEVMRELGVQVDSYASCNMEINRDFMLAGDWMRPYHRELPPLLADGVRVLNYAGDADFICNWYGNKAWALELDWTNKEGFNRTPDRAWYLGTGKKRGEPVGEVRQGLGMSFVRVFGAGHMMPYDQPAAGADMIEKWLANEEF